MWRWTLGLLKRRTPPMGYSAKDWASKSRSPRASKPWRDRHVTSAGSIEVSANTDAMTDDGGTLLGSLTTAAPLGLRSVHMPPQAAMQQTAAHSSAAAGWLLPAGESQDHERPAHPHALLGSASLARRGSEEDDLAVQPRGHGRDGGPYGVQAGVPRSFIPAAPLADPATDRGLAAAPMASLPFGKALDLHVEGVTTYDDGPTPIHLQHLRRSRREVADAIVLPRHINKLFHKIMGWSEELVEMDADQRESEEETGQLRTKDSDPGAPPAPSSTRDGEPTPRALRQKMSNLTNKVKYGVLLDAYEKDRFALTHQLEVAGDRLERKFLEWEGVHVLDQDATQDMANVRAHKAAVVMETPSSFHIPAVNSDCCPGCGALLQDKTDAEFGYVAPGEVERFVVDQQRKVQARHDYAQRMAELQAHWEKHGRQVGEEWLDFMTQEEFNAFYRDRQQPFLCHRCHALENLGVVGRRKVWSAPDFTEKLRALKEERGVFVLVVDVTDFPGSMVYDLPGLISMNNDVILVANKMDCVRNRRFGYDGRDRAVSASLVSERYVRRWVLDIAVQFGLPRHRVRDVIAVSAKRGWNIDALIDAIEDAANLNLRRPHKPLPTYFVGVANAGKSSIINAIAHKLYVPQPPHPKSTKVYFTRTDKEGREAVFWRWHTPPNVNQAEMIDIRGRHDKKASRLLTVSSLPGTTVAMNAVRLSLHRAEAGKEERAVFYDTPGLLPHWHQQSPLTLLQMRRALIRKFRNPQCFILLPGHTLFLGGLAAVDVVKGPPRGLLFMVYASHKTRHGIVRTELSNSFWEEQLGRTLDPPGSLEQLSDSSGGTLRLSQSKSYLFECYAKHRMRPKADIYVCGLGWAAFCVSEPADVVLRVRTLPGVVHGVREPLRYNDLRAFNKWPKLQRRFTAKGIEDLEHDVDNESISTVVRLTASADGVKGAPTDMQSAEKDATDSGDIMAREGAVLRPVQKAEQPAHEPASSAPLDSLLEELVSIGKAPTD